MTAEAAPIIALFNHKGGVSKTTTTFNLGWALANREKRVLIVDGDPQCNLTGTVLGFTGTDDFEDFYKSNPNSDISSALEPVFAGSGTTLSPAKLTPTANSNLFLLAGNIAFSENETQVAVALSTYGAIPALQNIPGSISHLLRITAKFYDIDVVIIDMSPSVGAINECLLMGSDFFIVPTSPDYYCNQAIYSLARVLPKWNAAITPFRNSALSYSFPSKPPQFCGIISQRYRPRKGAPVTSFQQWIDIIKSTVRDKLIPVLVAQGMTISEASFRAAHPSDTPYNIANIADFNSLIAQSQKYNVPIFALTDAQIEQVGKVLDTMSGNRDDFEKTFNNFAACLETIASI